MKYMLIEIDDEQMINELRTNALAISDGLEWIVCQTSDDLKFRMINVEPSEEDFDQNTWKLRLIYEEHGTEGEISYITGTIESVQAQLALILKAESSGFLGNEKNGYYLEFSRAWTDREGGQTITAHLTRVEGQ